MVFPGNTGIRTTVPLTVLIVATLAGGGCGARAPEPPGRDALPNGGEAPGTLATEPSSSAFLALLPDGEEKRRFVLDCTGCHQLDRQVAFPGGAARSRGEWERAVARMVAMAGAHTPFPVVSAERRPGPTAEWLARHLTRVPAPLPGAPAGRGEVREYEYPYPRDLPHDLALDADGRVVITGMMTHRMLRLDPATGAYEETPIPVPNANPRAMEIDAEGSWWVLLGAPHRVARYRPGTGEWESWPVGMYAHDVRYDGRGRAWFNGHFTRDPELLGYVDVASGEVRTFQIPTHPGADAGSPIPYGLSVAPDGEVWMTELHGNRIVRFDPATERFRTYDLPTAHSGPRRPAFDAAGSFWIPQYAANKLARFDPATERFREYELPIPDALPYVVEVDRRSGRVWIGTGAADALLAFDPETERFTVYPLPSRGALVRDIAVDGGTGEVWAAYGASPGIPPRIARLRPER